MLREPGRKCHLSTSLPAADDAALEGATCPSKDAVDHGMKQPTMPASLRNLVACQEQRRTAIPGNWKHAVCTSIDCGRGGVAVGPGKQPACCLDEVSARQRLPAKCVSNTNHIHAQMTVFYVHHYTAR